MFLQVVLERGGGTGEGGEVLAEAVVQILADALLLALADLDDLALQLAGVLQEVDLGDGEIVPGAECGGAHGDEEEEEEAHAHAVGVDPAEGLGRGGELIGPPGDEQGDDGGEVGPFFAAIPCGEQDGRGVEDRHAELIRRDVIEKADDEDDGDGDAEEEALRLPLEEFGEMTAGGLHGFFRVIA